MYVIWIMLSHPFWAVKINQFGLRCRTVEKSKIRWASRIVVGVNYVVSVRGMGGVGQAQRGFSMQTLLRNKKDPYPPFPTALNCRSFDRILIQFSLSEKKSYINSSLINFQDLFSIICNCMLLFALQRVQICNYNIVS